MAELALGTVQFGVAYGIQGRSAPVSQDESRQILALAHDFGIRRLDTAPAYGDIEERLLDLCDGRQFDIVSKIPSLPADVSESEVVAFVTASLDRSLVRLSSGLRGILFHGPDDLLGPLGERAWDAAESWCNRNALPLGCSVYGPSQLAAVRNDFNVAMCQIPGSALDQRLTDQPDDLGGIEITIRSAFLQGLLLMPLAEAEARVPAAAQSLANWHRWREENGLDPVLSAFSVVKGFPKIDYCVVGVDKADQLAELLTDWDKAKPIEAKVLAIDDPKVIDPREWQ